jgi:preprotein translocase subunit Sec61beta
VTTERTVAPYGSWRSPLAVEEVVEQAILLSESWLDGDDLYWVESHPAEGGRRVLVRREPSGETTELTPAPANVRTRAHEYGGGSYTVAGGIVVYSEFSDGRLYRIDPGSIVAIPITPAG